MDFAPSVYEHAARVIDRRPWEVSRDPDLMFQGHAAAYRLYAHSPIVVGVDIYNLEAEACGAPVRDPGGNGLPAVADHPCADLAAMAALPHPDPRTDGRLPMVLDVGCRLAAEFPEADVRIPVSGPFSIAASLLGLDGLLLGVALEPEETRAALRHLVEGQAAFCADSSFSWRIIRSRSMILLKDAFFIYPVPLPLFHKERGQGGEVLLHKADYSLLRTVSSSFRIL